MLLRKLGLGWLLLATGILGGCQPEARNASAPTTNPVATSAAQPSLSDADTLMHEGAIAFRFGNFPIAITKWSDAADRYERAGLRAAECDALLDLTAARTLAGAFDQASDSCSIALDLARALSDRRREIDALREAATIDVCLRAYPAARQRLDEATKLAVTLHDPRVDCNLFNDRGNLDVARGDSAAAIASYQKSIDAGQQSGNPLAIARAMTNINVAVLRGGDAANGAFVNKDQLARATNALANGHEKAELLITQGHTYWVAMSDHANEDAIERYRRAAKIGHATGDPAVESLALGYQGEIDEAMQRPSAAMAETRRALLLAQQAQSPDLLYRWQWQQARLLRDAGRINDAMAAFDGAIETLGGIRADLANGYGNQVEGRTFRESIGPLYYQAADLLLKRADVTSDPADVQRLLLRARDTVELLKTGELEDYFQARCVNLLRKQPIEAIGRGTAVIYLIPLPDRTEMLLSTAGGMRRFKSAVTSEELTAEVREFRARLEDRSSNRYLVNARRLYNWIIRPIEPTLAAMRVDTLVFVPDGALRTIPMAALNDGKEFLIARYAIAITPGLTLMTPATASRQAQTAEPAEASKLVLKGGLSESVGGFPPLEFVPRELNGISALYPDGSELLNRSFTKSQLKAQISDHNFEYVHLASHAQFSQDQANTFLLTYGTGPSSERLTLAELGRLLNASRYRDRPIDLLALSACQTAAGDDRAALGLAGVAIEMGARSAVATLWSVNDQASADLVEDFYRSLRSGPTTTKAKAMRRAQLDLLEDVRYKHPCYWAPFLVIGNWN